MRHPKKHIDYYRRQQVLLTLAFAVLLFALITIVATGCAPKKNPVFSKPKYEVSTEHTTRGRANVRQKWGKNWWFWQKERRNTTPAP